jgi:hypothetical protein
VLDEGIEICPSSENDRYMMLSRFCIASFAVFFAIGGRLAMEPSLTQIDHDYVCPSVDRLYSRSQTV